MATDISLSEVQKDTESPSVTANPQNLAAEGKISLLDLLIILAERKRMIFIITGGFAILAIVISLILPQQYTATVTLLPPQQNSSAGSLLASQLGNLGGVAALAGS